MRRKLAFLMVIAVAAGGCSSVRTTFLKNDGQGNLCKETKVCKRGLPVMVKVPTHVDVKIIQTDVWRIDQDGKNPKKLVHLPEATSRRHEVKSIATEQMFIVDPKRPPSGSGSFGFTFASGDDSGKGILTGAKYESKDTTLKDTGNLLLNAATFAGKLASTKLANDNTKIVSAERTIAYKRFAVDANLEGNIQSFLDEYITHCADKSCTQSPAYAK